MDRYLMHHLVEWKENVRRMPLILRGPRQVGKSHLVEQFGKIHFKQMVTVNFDLSPELKRCFVDFSPTAILNQLELTLGVTIGTYADTLLFLDEIQECPQAIQALRYFKEQLPDLPVIAAGSLLEFVINQADFRMPVGRIQYLYLRPLCFEEYLAARGFEKLAVFLREATIEEGIPEVIHQRLTQLLQEYLIIGGMPAAIVEFMATNRFQMTQAVQAALLATYRNDFGKYAKHTQHRYLQILFAKAPGLVGEHFKFAKVDAELRARELKPALSLLEMAGLVRCIYRTNGAGLPLISTRDELHYKLHFLDVGLMVKAAELPAELLLRQDFFAINRGALMEQFVGQELVAHMPPDELGALYYWSREQKGSQAEVDYVMAANGTLIPIEVKAGRTGRLKSLHLFLQEKKLAYGVKVSLDPLALEGNILSVPAYMLQSLPRLVGKYSNIPVNGGHCS